MLSTIPQMFSNGYLGYVLVTIGVDPIFTEKQMTISTILEPVFCDTNKLNTLLIPCISLVSFIVVYLFICFFFCFSSTVPWPLSTMFFQTNCAVED